MRTAMMAMILAATLGHGAAWAQAEVDLELVLAADGSGSIDEGEMRFQREGYAQAITNPRVLDAILSGYNGRIALAYVEWGGPASQHTIIDWMVVDGAESAAAFAAALVTEPRAATGWNSISGAIDYAANLIGTNAHDGFRKIIDVSADSGHSGGRPVQAARDEAVGNGITINGLVVASRDGSMPGPNAAQLEEHFRRDIIGGDGAFVVVADEETGFAEAVLNKLLLEIADAR